VHDRSETLNPKPCVSKERLHRMGALLVVEKHVNHSEPRVRWIQVVCGVRR